MKALARLFLLCALPLAGAAALRAQPASQAVILQYHHVSTTTPASTSISPADFRAHMDYLAGHGFHVLPLEDIVDALRAGRPLPDKAAAITFDDGYRSVYDSAYPLLTDLGFPFTVFVNPALVGSNAELYANWEQLREMGAHSVTLANHTVDHPYLLTHEPGEDDAQWLQRVRREISAAEAVIEKETGQDRKLLAYPYGEYDPRIQQLVRELGYVGFGQHSGPISAGSDFSALPRFPFSGIYASLTTFETKVNSLAFDVVQLSPDTPITADPSPAAELQFKGSYRLDALACYDSNSRMQVNAEAGGKQVYRIATTIRHTARRFRYNCTAPGPGGRYYWYSIPWINPAVAE